MRLISYTAQDGTCTILIPNYNHRNKILVREAVTRQETDEEFLTRLEIPFESKSEMTGLIAALNPKRYKKKTIEVEPAEYRDETDDEVLARVIEKDIPAGSLHPTVIEDTQLPHSGYRPETGTRTVAMRNSWVNPPDTTSPPVVDMVKARQAKMDLEWKPRRERLLVELDKEMQFAEEIPDQAAQQRRKSEIIRDKQRLRDMPVDFAAAAEAITDPKELDEFDPVIDIIVNMESV